MSELNLIPNSWGKPLKKVLEGQYCILAPFSIEHIDQLFEVRTVPDEKIRYEYLFGSGPTEKEPFINWAQNLISSEDPMVWVVIDKDTGKVEGKQNLMRISLEFGTIEIGGIMWGPNIAKTRVTTEAFFLFAEYIFNELNYRRFEWKCNNANSASKSAALRFGFQFEGVFRQHMIQNGQNRDTAWFSILDSDWPSLRESFIAWLRKSNFDENKKQVKSLNSF